MIEMIEKKQWSRLMRNGALVAMLMVLAVGFSGCAKTVVSMKEADKPVVDPGLMVPVKPQKNLVGQSTMSKHLREQAAERRRTALKDQKTKGLQGFVDDSQQYLAPEK